jgi:hypothetical protein
MPFFDFSYINLVFYWLMTENQDTAETGEKLRNEPEPSLIDNSKRRQHKLETLEP